MKTVNLLAASELPDGFTYPQQFCRAVDLGLMNLEPWYLIEGEELHRTLKGLRERYQGRRLIPFARRQDNDDIACWEVHGESVIVVIHDFASPGWEQSGRFECFWDWFRQAVEDMIEFDT